MRHNTPVKKGLMSLGCLVMQIHFDLPQRCFIHGLCYNQHTSEGRW